MSSLLTKRAIFTTAATASAAGTFYHTYTSSRPSPSPSIAKKMPPAYEATFSVPLECDDCIKDISSALEKLPGIHSTTFSLPKSMLTTTGTTPPSTIIRTIQSTGRPAILRGSGNSNSAAVCILEIPPSPPSSDSAPSTNSISKPPPEQNPVRGLIRFIELSSPSPSPPPPSTAVNTNGATPPPPSPPPAAASSSSQQHHPENPPLTLLDLTLTGLRPGTYTASLRTSGDISRGATSLGGIFSGLDGTRDGELGTVAVDGHGRGECVREIGWPIWEAVGRGVVVRRDDRGRDHKGDMEGGGRGDEVVIGVVARSAGVWENEKVVCGCSGKTVWEEREEMLGRGIL